MKPVIVLVGQPNVGKSTLFNRLTRSRDALVSDFPGLTRDRIYGTGRLGGRSYIVVDTGGLSGERSGIEALIAGQAWRAVAEADLVFFVVDGRAGMSGGDVEVSQRLRSYGRPIVLAINKAEGLDPEITAADFHALGITPSFCISASHGDGVVTMIEESLASLPVGEGEETDETQDDGAIRIAIVGRPNAGKSTLVNRILGEERVLSFDQPGTTRDSIFIPFEREGARYILIDTAGVRRRSRVQDSIEKISVIKTLQAIDGAHVVILVLDAHEGIAEQDARLLGHCVESGRGLVIAINKWDGLDESTRARVRAELDRKLAFVTYARCHFISALHGTGVGDLYRSVQRAYRAATAKLATPRLTRVLEAAVQQHAPPLVRGRRIKLRYAHQGGQTPPVVVIHGNQVQAVPDGYRRYLENFFRQQLRLEGTPVRIEFKGGVNPFQGRKNVLTPRQQDKRRRLKRYLRKGRT
jgi:GTP-binding protein